MRIVKRILAGIVVLAVLLTLIAYVLPRRAEVSRSIEIAAPPEAVYAVVSDLRRMNEWSPWAEIDPETEYTFTGPIEGVGQTMNWESASPQVGSGSQSIIRLEPGREVDTALDFGSMGAAEAMIDLEPAGAGTKVTWGFTTDLGFNPIGRYMGLMFDSWIGADYERGLAKLKSAVEAAPAPTPAAASPPSG
jgi:carbon monoxide dehydrogenase subunit G